MKEVTGRILSWDGVSQQGMIEGSDGAHYPFDLPPKNWSRCSVRLGSDGLAPFFVPVVMLVLWVIEPLLQLPRHTYARFQVEVVKGGEKVYHCGGGIVYHRHDEKGLNWEPDGIRSGAGVRSSGVSQESTGSSDTWEAALCRLCLRR